MSDPDEILVLTESDTETDSESSECESEVEEKEEVPVTKGNKAKKPQKISRTSLGEIERSDSPPPPPRVRKAPRKQSSEEVYQKRCENLAKARAARSALAAQKKKDKLQAELDRYDIREESSSSSEDEIVLTKKRKQQVILSEKEQKKLETKTHTLPKIKEKEPKIEVDDVKSIAKRKARKLRDAKLAALEEAVNKSAAEKKKDRRKTTIINVNSAPEKKAESKVTTEAVTKLFLDLGI